MTGHGLASLVAKDAAEQPSSSPLRHSWQCNQVMQAAAHQAYVNEQALPRHNIQPADVTCACTSVSTRSGMVGVDVRVHVPASSDGRQLEL